VTHFFPFRDDGNTYGLMNTNDQLVDDEFIVFPDVTRTILSHLR